MKLKQTPDDFQVEELTAIVPTDGPFALYRLNKRGYTTPDALAVVRERWRIEPNRVSVGGLKDRHAATLQYFTILQGPRRRLTHTNIEVEYLGQAAAPFTSKDIAANRFHIVLRDVDVGLVRRAEALGRNGIPNYFDDQRFGSADVGGEFIARLMVLGRYEEALKLALTAPYEFDRAEQKREKATLIRLWGGWQDCAGALSNGMARRIAVFLTARSGDFRGTVRLLHPELQGMYLAAYQSFIWNRMLAALVRRDVAECSILRLKLGSYPTALQLTEQERTKLAATILPLPSARLAWDADAPWAALVESALADQGFPLAKMKLPGLRQPFFSRGERAAWVVPDHFTASPHKDGIALAFELPRGSYATIVVKHLQQEPPTK